VPEFFVAVPSYGRANVIGEKTLALLERQGVPPERVYIFVADEGERYRYAQNLGRRWPNLVVGRPTLWRQRNFITEFFDEDSHVISMDDDVEDLFRLIPEPDGSEGGELESLHAGALADLARDAWTKMGKCGAYLWSLNVSDNPFYMKKGRVTLKNGLCNGFFWGCRIRKTPKLSLRYGDGHEDIERTVRYFDLDGAVLRYREFCAKTRCKINSGGLQASMTRRERQAAEEDAIHKLAQEFWHLLVEVPGTILGVKFRIGAATVFGKHSMVSAMQFRDLAATDGLAHLEGACWGGVRSRSAGSSVAGTIKRSDAKGLRLEACLDGSACLLGPKVDEFYAALRDELVFIVWLPRPSCGVIGIPYQEIPENLHHLFEPTRNENRAVSIMTDAGTPGPEGSGTSVAATGLTGQAGNSFSGQHPAEGWKAAGQVGCSSITPPPASRRRIAGKISDSFSATPPAKHGSSAMPLPGKRRRKCDMRVGTAHRQALKAT